MAKKLTIQPNNPHFFKFIMPDDGSLQVQGISIPRAFVKNYLAGEKCEGNKARLRIKKSKKSWMVSTKGCCFTDGWKDFYIDNDLQAGDFLLFKHKGGFRFDVIVFDATMCEKVYPSLKDGDTKDNPILMDMDKPGKKKQVPKDFPGLKLLKNTAKVKNPLQLVVQMQRSHFKYGTLSISVPFGRKSGLLKIAKRAKDTNESYIITITDPNGKPWEVRLNYKPSAKIAYFGLGWIEFWRANKLKVGDVCTFKLVSMAPKKIVMEMTVSKRKSSSLKAKFACK